MKIATNIILAAIAIVLAVNILSTIEKSQVDTIKHTFAIEETKILNNTLENFILIPKKYGLDTVKIQGHRVDRVLKDITENGKVISEFTEYYVVTRFNRVVYSYSTYDYELDMTFLQETRD